MFSRVKASQYTRRSETPGLQPGVFSFVDGRVRWDAFVGWGDGDRGRVLYVRVQTGTGLDDANSRWLSDSRGLSAFSEGELTRTSLAQLAGKL